MPHNNSTSHQRLQQIFLWLWGSLFATVISLLVFSSLWLSVLPLCSTTWALQQLLQSQLVVQDANDWDLELQPLEQAGVVPQRRRNMTAGQALRQAFLNYMEQSQDNTSYISNGSNSYR